MLSASFNSPEIGSVRKQTKETALVRSVSSLRQKIGWNLFSNH